MLNCIQQAAGRATLVYKSTCPPCQWMSRLVVLFSLGTIQRVALNSAEAHTLYQAYPEHEGQLALFIERRITFGRRVFLVVPRTIISVWWHRLVRVSSRRSAVVLDEYHGGGHSYAKRTEE